jgi:hypothetical protein
LDQLLASLGQALAGTPRYRQWTDWLQPLSFEAVLEERRQGFTGRAWLLDEVASWAGAGSGPALVLTGDPGVGKSAALAELAHTNPDGMIVAHYCCQANAQETLLAGSFVRTLAAMLAARLPQYAEMLALPGAQKRLSPARAARDPVTALEQGVLNPITRLPDPKKPRLILVDALDEAELRLTAGGVGGPELRDAAPPTIAQVLAGALGRFPSWLKVVATTRNDSAVLDRLAAFERHQLKADDRRNRDDLQAYVADRLTRPTLAGRLTGTGTGEEVERLVKEKAAGNFLYARQALDALERGLLTPAQLHDVPPGLEALLAEFLEREFPDETAWAPVRDLFEVLVAADEPLDTQDLAAALGLDAESQLPDLLANASAYLQVAGQPPRFAFYHKAFSDWLGEPGRRGRYRADPRGGHRRLAEGFWARYASDPLARLSPYGLAHLVWHLSAWGATDPAARAEVVDRVGRFVLDRRIQQRRINDPAGVMADLGQAVQLAADQTALAPLATAPSLVRLALGTEWFRRDRLDPARLFEEAANGEVASVERELDLYEADQFWWSGTRLVAAWLAHRAGSEAAGRLRAGVIPTGSALDEHVAAAFDHRSPTVPGPAAQLRDDAFLDGLLAEVGGMDLEGRRGLAEAFESTVAPPPEAAGDLEEVRYLAEFHAPYLVRDAVEHPQAGTARLQEYIRLQATNAYRVYRNESLWRILQDVTMVDDTDWVMQIARALCGAALSPQGHEDTSAITVAVAAARLAGGGQAAPQLQAAGDAAKAGTATLSPVRGLGDSWGGHRRKLAAWAEAQAFLGPADLDGRALLEHALGIPEGFAGFQATACHTLAEALAVSGADWTRVLDALEQAQVAAHNVQDPTFCARTTSRCLALRDDWWRTSGGTRRPIDLLGVVDQFATEPRHPVFTARHVVGWHYPGRRPSRSDSSRLPDWVRDAVTLPALARAYQWPLEEFKRVNPEVDPTGRLPAKTEIRVPDPRFAPWVAARLAADVLAAKWLEREERVALMGRLVPPAIGNLTALSTVLGRLVLALGPTASANHKDLEDALTTYLPSDVNGGNGGVAADQLGPT